MAFPSYVTPGGAVSSAAADVSPTLPTHAANTVFLCGVENAADVAINTPSGGSLTWAEVSGSPVTASGTRLAVFWARASTATETGPTVFLNGGNHILANIVGFNNCRTTSNPIESTVTSVQDTASTAVTCPATATLTNEATVLHICSRANDASGQHFTWDAHPELELYAEGNGGDFGTGSGNGGGISWARGALTTAGSVSAATATLSVSTTQARMTLVLASVEATITATPSLMLLCDG